VGVLVPCLSVALSALIAIGGCSSAFGAASIDLTNITINAGQTATAGNEVLFTIHYTNRSREPGEISCTVNPIGGSASLEIPGGMSEGITELRLPGLAAGKHEISCGPIVDGNRPSLFVMTRDFLVSPAPNHRTSGVSVTSMQISDNQTYWGGTLTLVVGFDNPGLGDGIIRCATFPSSEGAEVQSVKAEPTGEKTFVLTFPGRVSANYRVMCDGGDRLISGLTSTLSEPFFVSQ